jgi:mono/diheme cytochrome c family protein
MRRLIPAVLAAMLVPAIVASAPPRGQALFIAQGCSLCHGTVGQGAPGTGATLVPLRLSDAQVLAYVRAPKGVMPKYGPNVLPDTDIQAIAAWLRTLPPPRPIERIALLARYRAPAAPGRTLFAQNCAACHGAERQGGAGPSLIGEARKRDAAAVAALLAAPPPGMPRFVPDQLSAQQARAIAAFVVSP